MQSDPKTALGPDGVPLDWADCPKCGAMRFYPSGRCMQFPRCDGGEPRTQTAAPNFQDFLEFDAIRRENHCTVETCAYEDGCECFREFKELRSGSNEQ